MSLQLKFKERELSERAKNKQSGSSLRLKRVTAYAFTLVGIITNKNWEND